MDKSKKSRATASRTPTPTSERTEELPHQTRLAVSNDGRLILLDETTGEEVSSFEEEDGDDEQVSIRFTY